MPLLVILKRFEVWLLAAVVISLLIFAFRPEPHKPEPSPVIGTAKNPSVTISPGESKETLATAEAEAGTGKVIAVSNVKVTGNQEGMIVELTLSGRSLSGEDLTLDESTVSATTGEGEPVNRFFEPFSEPAVLLASEDSLATLKWWLEQPAGAIWLNLQGQRVKAELP